MRLISISLIAIMALSWGYAPASYSTPSDIPLMVLRYNQPRIYYDRQLYNAARRALDIKPDVVFSLVSFIPQTGNDNQQDMQREEAARQMNQLVTSLKQMGLPDSRISVSQEMVDNARHHEIYMYVD